MALPPPESLHYQEVHHFNHLHTYWPPHLPNSPLHEPQPPKIQLEIRAPEMARGIHEDLLGTGRRCQWQGEVREWAGVWRGGDVFVCLEFSHTAPFLGWRLFGWN